MNNRNISLSHTMPTTLSKESLYSFLHKSCEADGSKPCIITEERTYTRSEVLKIVEGLAAHFHGKGMRNGDFVAVRTTRSADSMMLILALHTIGAICVATDPYSKVGEYIRQSKTDLVPKFYITNEGAGMDISARGNWFLLDAEEKVICNIEFEIAEYDSQLIRTLTSNISVTSPSLVLFTSGSTGKSKAVVHGQYSYINNSVDAEFIQDHYGQLDDVSICVLCPHHILGFAVFVNAVVTAHAVFFPKEITPDYVLSCIEKHSITRMYSVPTYYLALIANDRHKKYNLSSFRFGLTAAGPITPEQFLAVEEGLGFNLVPVYGMSEYVALTCGAFDIPSEIRASGVGLFFPSNQGFILDDEGNSLPVGEVGEICVKGYASMLGYYNDPEETANTIDSQNRLHTGDLGYLDEYGILHIVGRKKDIIIRGGENLSPLKIEEAILSLPFVAAAAVVGVKDNYYGEVPAALVVLRTESFDAEVVREELLKKLPKNHIPERICIVKEIPLTTTGKVDKVKIKGMFQ